MAKSSAAASASLSKKKVTNDSLDDHNPSDRKTMNLGLHTGTSSGAVDQTAAAAQAEQPSAKKPGKRPRQESDAKYYKKMRMKVEGHDEKTMELQELKIEHERAKLDNERLKLERSHSREQHKELMNRLAKTNVKLDSHISSSNSDFKSIEQKLETLLKLLEDEWKKKEEEFNRQIEYWRDLCTTAQREKLSFQNQFQQGLLMSMGNFQTQQQPLNMGNFHTQQQQQSAAFVDQSLSNPTTTSGLEISSELYEISSELYGSHYFGGGFVPGGQEQ